MTELNAEAYASEITDKFYSILGLKPCDDAIILSSDIRENRSAIESFYMDVTKAIHNLPASDMKALYETVKEKVNNGSIGSFEVVFENNGEKEPQQDRHPLLRMIDFVAHRKRSIQAYSYKNVDMHHVALNVKRFEEIGDHYEFRGKSSVILHLFLDAEKMGFYGREYEPVDNILDQAVQYEQDVVDHTIASEELVAAPQLLRERFDEVVGEYRNMGMGGVHVDVPHLMKWEAIADNALLPLSVAELKVVYDHYNQMKKEWGDVTSVIMSEISTVCGQNKDLEPFLKWGGMMSETHCDVRVSHLVGGSGRFVANLEEAFVECLSQSGQQSDNHPTKKPS
jgi:hypothetical protein